MKEPIWLTRDFVMAAHERLIDDFGGSTGIRDSGLLESALSRPRHLYHYEKASLFDLAATYAHGLMANHPFIDGNKRSGFLAAATFLQINGYELTAPEPEATVASHSLATREWKAKEFAAWLRKNSRRAR